MMTRSHILALMALAVAVPAAGAAGGSFFAKKDSPCFGAGTIGYQLTADRRADFTIRIDSAANAPDLVVQFVDDPGIADFVLADGSDDLGGCSGATAIRSIRDDPQAREPDLTIALAPRGADARYKIYAHSPDFTAQDAAALFAVMSKAARKGDSLAAR